MRQFDSCRLRPAAGRSNGVSLVVILQADLIDQLNTRVVAPLVDDESLPSIHRLRPEINCEGRRYRMIADRLSVLNKKSLGKVVGSCADHEYDIRRALDIVFIGVCGSGWR